MTKKATRVYYYASMERYLRRRGITTDAIRSYFEDPESWIEIEQKVRSKAEVERKKANRARLLQHQSSAESTPINEVLVPSVAESLMQWSYRNQRLRTLGDIIQHPRARIEAIPGIKDEPDAMRRIDIALGGRSLSFRK